MDVFALRDSLVDEYRRYVGGFVRVKERRAAEYVRRYYDEDRLWPEALVQLNPAFGAGRSVEALTREGLLHNDCARIFRRREQPGDLGLPIRLHRHQDEAIAAARSGQSYVLTTGTGSGKSLAYFIPIVDHVLRHPNRRGLSAIVVYPMNALCNSQRDALDRFLGWSYPDGRGPVRFDRYTGQESDADRARIIANPPDILLTNFVMLELILTRADEAALVEQCRGLEFLVLDELHTYRGRQGADVAMLVRRLRERCGAPTLRCVGTSATLAGSGSWQARRAEVASVASRLFGLPVPAENVIGETLRRATVGDDPAPQALAATLREAAPFPTDYATLAGHPLAIWAEGAFGLRHDEHGRLERRPPRTVSEAAGELAKSTGMDAAVCAARLRQLLLAGFAATDPVTGAPLFAFRLHQFISRGDSLYATPEPPDARVLSAEGQQYVAGDRSRHLYPTAFCRVCGQDFLVVTLEAGKALRARQLNERAAGDDAESGYLVVDGAGLPDLYDHENLPEEWLEIRRGVPQVRRDARARLPRRLRVEPDGSVMDSEDAPATNAWFIPAPFRFCPACGVTYAMPRQQEFTRLAQLSSEGRSTATTVLSLALVRALRADVSLSETARKLLSFTDNRQDAALQAGHFNDFVQVALLRAAILAAVKQAGPAGLGHDEVAQRVTQALGLEFADYASNPLALFGSRRATEEALREVTGYRVYHDLRRGWRIVSPNLEAVGLLRIAYLDLPELCAEPSIWQGKHRVLAQATPAEREAACRTLLDHLRRGLAIKVRYLDPHQQDAIRQQSGQYLRPPWSLDENETLDGGILAVLRREARQGQEDMVLGPRTLAGRYLGRRNTWPSVLAEGARLSLEEIEALTHDLLEALVQGGQVEVVAGVPGAYQLVAGCMRWQLGDGQPLHDPIRVPRRAAAETAVHPFFTGLYQVAAESLQGLEAREHTAQVPGAVREEREQRFAEATLPVLYCSPTMELGVDIRDLNAVNMRNVPPTPANYAQRSGRAGRSGQPALVLTYCTTYSPHDQYYFRRPIAMVAGAVQPPRLDLANEELVRAHVHAVWLAETGQSLYSSVNQLLDLGDDALPLKPGVRDYVERATYQELAADRCRRILAELSAELTPTRAPWYTEGWLEATIRNAPKALDRAADRWRHLYRSARQQRDRQHAIAGDHLRTREEQEAARRLRAEAESQLSLLTLDRQNVSSDFYSYRYFATEGFLPGYNFPRLPVTAYIPGRQLKGGEEEFLTRPRFIALSEFGPRAVVYHEGSRYRVTRVTMRRDGEAGDVTTSARCCGVCGYAHFGEEQRLDRCRHCQTLLTAANSQVFHHLLRLESVSTDRVDRINCDEEERLRQGFDMLTMFRLDEREEGSPVIESVFGPPEAPLATATYGPATTIWRVNLGARRRMDKALLGFVLDVEKGRWSRKDAVDEEGDDEDGPDGASAPSGGHRALRVLPFVEDRRNALLFRLREPLALNDLLSLQEALQRGIQMRYQLEPAELAVEPLPNTDTPRALLFYEASEGGAGVLVRLATEPGALAEVAREALRLCHFDPDTGEDWHRAERAPEDCEAACYDCLLSYYNQRYHDRLDRHLALPWLRELSRVSASVGTGGTDRTEQRERLLRHCQSDLERQFVTWLDERGYRLPDRAQALIDGLAARPDFTYAAASAHVYVDGHPHHFADRQARDRAQTEALEDAGWRVLRVRGPESWPAAVAAWADVFGQGRGKNA